MNAATNPKLYVVQNPAEKLQPEEKLELVRYIISVKEIQSKSSKTWT